jgi:hypothetical protein
LKKTVIKRFPDVGASKLKIEKHSYRQEQNGKKAHTSLYYPVKGIESRPYTNKPKEQVAQLCRKIVWPEFPAQQAVAVKRKTDPHP